MTEHDGGFVRGAQDGLVSTHNLVKPKVVMTAKDFREAKEKFVAARKIKAERAAEPAKGGKK